MYRVVCVAALAALLSVPASPAVANGLRWFRSDSSGYYYPGSPAPVAVQYAPAYYTPVIVCVPTAPAAPVPIVSPSGPYAQPVPAPPSAGPRPQTGEPPLADPGKGAPKVSESRLTAKKSAGDARDRVRVGFWNVSGRDLTLTIDGQPRVVLRDRCLTITLGRNFTWQIDQRPAELAEVPAGNDTLEIVIRK
jgi:hypothetical protein